MSSSRLPPDTGPSYPPPPDRQPGFDSPDLAASPLPPLLSRIISGKMRHLLAVGPAPDQGGIENPSEPLKLFLGEVIEPPKAGEVSPQFEAMFSTVSEVTDEKRRQLRDAGIIIDGVEPLPEEHLWDLPEEEQERRINHEIEEARRRADKVGAPPEVLEQTVEFIRKTYVKPLWVLEQEEIEFSRQDGERKGLTPQTIADLVRAIHQTYQDRRMRDEIEQVRRVAKAINATPELLEEVILQIRLKYARL